MPRIELTFSDGHIERFPLKPSTVIGRGRNCDIVIIDESISRQHLKIELGTSGIFITDLGSTNGVMIDGKKISPNTRYPYQTFFTFQFGPFREAQILLD